MSLFNDPFRNLYDPFGSDPYADPFSLMRARRPREPARFPPLEPDVADSLLTEIGSKALGGLQYVAETLDKPGRAVRGLLAGRPGELANLIPFSDTLGITDPRKQTTGRDLLEQYAGLSANKPGLFNSPTDFLGDVAGFGVEVVSDPFFDWLKTPARALTATGEVAAKLGKAPNLARVKVDDALMPVLKGNKIQVVRDTAEELAASAAQTGKLAPTIESRMLAGQGGLLGIGVPFRPSNAVFGTGPRAQWVARNVLDPTVQKLVENPLTRYAGRLLDASRKNMQSVIGQRLASQITTPALQEAGGAAAEEVLPYVREAMEKRLLDGDFERAMRLGAEQFLSIEDVTRLRKLSSDPQAFVEAVSTDPKLAAMFPQQEGQRLLPDTVGAQQPNFPSGVSPAVQAQYGRKPSADYITRLADAADLGRRMRQHMPAKLQRLQEMGIGTGPLKDLFANYFPRYHHPKELERVSDAFVRAFEEYGKFLNKARIKDLKDIPFGTVGIDDMVRDARISGKNRLLPNKEALEVIARDHFGFNMPYADLTDAMQRKVQSVADYLHTLSDEHALNGVGLFNGNPVVDFLLYSARTEKQLTLADTLYELMALTGHRGGKRSPGDMTFGEILGDIPGIRRQFPTTVELGGRPVRIGADLQAAQRFAEQGGVDFAPFSRKAKDVNLRALDKDIVVPAEFVPDVKRYVELWNTPEEIGSILRVTDVMQQLFRTGQTTIWPAFHVRNLLSGVTQNYLAGATDPRFTGIRALYQPFKDAWDMMHGREVEGIDAKAFDDEMIGRRVWKAESFSNEPLPGQGAKGGGAFQTELTTESVPRIPVRITQPADLSRRQPVAVRPDAAIQRTIPGGAQSVEAITNIPEAQRGAFTDALTKIKSTSKHKATKTTANDAELLLDPQALVAKALKTPSAGVGKLEGFNAWRQAITGPEFADELARFGVTTTAGAAPSLSQLAAMVEAGSLPQAVVEDLYRMILGNEEVYAKLFPKQRAGAAAGLILDVRGALGGDIAKVQNLPEELAFDIVRRSPAQAAPDIANQLIEGPKPAGMVPQTPVSDIVSEARQPLAQTEKAGIRGLVDRGDVIAQRAVKTGRKVGQFVEDLMRGAHYIAMRRQGLTAEQAAMSVKKWHFDYSAEAFTQFERNVLKRGIPFYSFMKQNLPLTIRELIENPGGRMAQTIRASTAGTGADQGFVPSWIREQGAVPLGEEQDGTRRFLTGLGLPVEEAFSRFKGGPEWKGRTTESWLSALRPELKVPLELLTGRSFYAGRPLDTMDPLLGRTISNVASLAGVEMQPPQLPGVVEHLAANSPLARTLSTLRTVTDPRKRGSVADVGALGANLLSGIRVTDANVAQGRREAEQALDATLKQSPLVRSFEKQYVPGELAPFVDPRLDVLMRLQSAVDKRRREEAEARRQQALRIPVRL